jgi:MSHA biogenesis protein MshK
VFESSGKWQVASGKGVARFLSVTVCAFVLTVAAAHTQADEVRDPTRPPQMSHHAPPPAPVPRDFVLQSTRVSGELRSAVINGRVVAVGDRVDGAQVLALESARARLRDSSGEFTLTLAVPEIVRPARNTRAPGEAKP